MNSKKGATLLLAVRAQQHDKAANAEQQRETIAQGRAFAEHRPGEQRGPDRHGVDQQRAFADREIFHRHGAEAHPRKYVGEGGATLEIVDDNIADAGILAKCIGKYFKREGGVGRNDGG